MIYCNTILERTQISLRQLFWFVYQGLFAGWLGCSGMLQRSFWLLPLLLAMLAAHKAAQFVLLSAFVTTRVQCQKTLAQYIWLYYSVFPLSSISLQFSKVLFVAASMTTIPLLCNMASQGKPAFRTLVFNMPAFHWLLNAVLFYVAQEIGANEKELHSGLEIQWHVEMIEMIEMM